MVGRKIMGLSLTVFSHEAGFVCWGWGWGWWTGCCTIEMLFISRSKRCSCIYTEMPNFSRSMRLRPMSLPHAWHFLSLIAPKLFRPPSSILCDCSTATDLSPSFPPLDPAPKSHLLVPNKLPQHPHPTRVARQIGIELPRHLVQRR